MEKKYDNELFEMCKMILNEISELKKSNKRIIRDYNDMKKSMKEHLEKELKKKGSQDVLPWFDSNKLVFHLPGGVSVMLLLLVTF